MALVARNALHAPSIAPCTLCVGALTLCRCLCAHAGDTQALPGYVSFYLQLQDPNSSSSNRWDCFASYKLAVLSQGGAAAAGRDATSGDLSRESWHRFSSRPARQQSRPLSSSSHGWADFASAAQARRSPACLQAASACCWHVAHNHAPLPLSSFMSVDEAPTLRVATSHAC